MSSTKRIFGNFCGICILGAIALVAIVSTGVLIWMYML